MVVLYLLIVVFIYLALQRGTRLSTLKTIILVRFLRDFEIDKHNRWEFLYYYCCGDDNDGLDAGSGSKNVKTRKSSKVVVRPRPNIHIRPNFT